MSGLGSNPFRAPGLEEMEGSGVKVEKGSRAGTGCRMNGKQGQAGKSRFLKDIYRKIGIF